MTFHKHNESDVIYWMPPRYSGDIRFSFDKEKIYNFYSDYPHKLTSEEVEIFKKECPVLGALK